VADKKKRADRKSRPKKPKKKSAELVDQTLIYGLAHPLRVRCLALLCDEPSSPRRLSDELDEGLSQVAYHVKVLRETGLIEPAGTRPARGATEHFYRAVHPLVIPEGLWAQLPKSARQKIYADVLTDIDNDVTASVKAGTFDAREDFHVSWTPMRLDDQGCKDLAARTDRFLEEMLEVQAESAKRLGEKKGKCVPVSAAVLVFESARDSGKGASERKRG
jgi:DNA-binding transcriptional ArsR family regulator